MLEVFSDRVIISSPGLPPTPITLERLRKAKYRPSSRNPLLAQCLSAWLASSAQVRTAVQALLDSRKR